MAHQTSGRRTSRFSRLLLGLPLALSLVAGLPSGPLPVVSAQAKPAVQAARPVPIAVYATPITHFHPGSDQSRFGRLTFLGGLELVSSDPVFGGISAFHLEGNNRFLALTDAGMWLDGRLDLDGERPIGLSDVRAAPLKDDRGRIMAHHKRGDAESLALAPHAIYVGLERKNEIWRFPRPPFDATRAHKGKRVPVKGLRALPYNRGLESLLYVPSGPLEGALLAIGEDAIRKGGDLPGFIIGGAHPGRFTIRKSGYYNATDVALSPRGELFLLERHFSLMTGVLMQIRRFDLADVKPGAVLTGDVLGSFDFSYEIDNMEGLSVTMNDAGDTLLTLIADDNFSMMQRTLLLRFAFSSN
ncbi:esterase-like activity of phytase family protein [Xanthobacter sp. TB0139]|uniref:esterase-like activity of phytase family protein n=1 Tax=Xanthobacter sp. TB0139 TaxID=3459178 RepID=UPI0040395C2F